MARRIEEGRIARELHDTAEAAVLQDEPTEPFSPSKAALRAEQQHGVVLTRDKTSSVSPVPDTAPPSPRLVLPAEKVAAARRALTESESSLRLANILEGLSLASLPDARLILRHPYWDDAPMPVIRLPESVDGWDTFGVVQSTHAVGFTMRLPLCYPPDQNAGQRRYSLEFKMFYNPRSDSCVFANQTSFELRLQCIKPDPEEQRLAAEAKAAVHPGLWRILFKTKNQAQMHVMDFLLLRRKFTAKRQGAATLAGASSKRRASSSPEVSEKRPRHEAEGQDGSAVQDQIHIVIAPATAAPTIREIDTSSASLGSLLDLKDGDIVTVSNIGSGRDEYTIERVRKIAMSASAGLFAMKHSALASSVVAKVMRHETYTTDDLIRCARTWENEQKYLERLHHVRPANRRRKISWLIGLHQANIIALMGADARVFTLYVEQLPPSLQHWNQQEFTAKDTSTILRDMASALEHLASKNIAHNDIKPANICYSPERGAVLIDFGLASDSRDAAYNGGSPWYIPPEYQPFGKRGTPGDVWALGVTMLYVCGKVDLPERSGMWRISEVRHLGSAGERMGNWVAAICKIAESVRSPESSVDSILSCMLCTHPRKRISASGILARLNALEIKKE